MPTPRHELTACHPSPQSWLSPSCAAMPEFPKDGHPLTRRQLGWQPTAPSTTAGPRTEHICRRTALGFRNHLPMAWQSNVPWHKGISFARCHPQLCQTETAVGSVFLHHSLTQESNRSSPCPWQPLRPAQPLWMLRAHCLVAALSPPAHQDSSSVILGGVQRGKASSPSSDLAPRPAQTDASSPVPNVLWAPAFLAG